MGTKFDLDRSKIWTGVAYFGGGAYDTLSFVNDRMIFPVWLSFFYILGANGACCRCALVSSFSCGSYLPLPMCVILRFDRDGCWLMLLNFGCKSPSVVLCAKILSWKGMHIPSIANLGFLSKRLISPA